MYNTLNPFITMIELNLFGEPETVIFDTLEEMSWKEFIDNPIIPGNIIMKSHNFIIPKDCLSTISILKNSLEVDEIINQYTISNIKLSKEGLLESLDITDNITGKQRTLYDWDIRKILYNNKNFISILNKYGIKYSERSGFLTAINKINEEIMKSNMISNTNYINWKNTYGNKAKLLGKLVFIEDKITDIQSSLEEFKLPPIRFIVFRNFECSKTKKLIIDDNTIKISTVFKEDSQLEEIDFGHACFNMLRLNFSACPRLKTIKAHNPIDLHYIRNCAKLEELELHILQLDNVGEIYFTCGNLEEIKFVW